MLKNKIKTPLRIIIVFILLFSVGFIGIIIYAIVSDYKPNEIIVLSTNEESEILTDSTELSIITWNIGYCGMDKEMDFFYDGGTKVVTPRENCIVNLYEIREFLEQNDTADFFLIQEIDLYSKRSYYMNQYDSLSKSLGDFSPSFAKNFDVFFVPLPLMDPMGKVLGGLSTFSKYQPTSIVRHSFPGEYSFPKQLFMLDRCFLVHRYPVSNNKELLIINTHVEAFDPGQIRKEQMAYLKDFVINEYRKGNYVITGGDWNQTPPEFQPKFSSNKADNSAMVIPADYLPSTWKWSYDNKNPSERNVESEYNPSTTPTTVFDFFLLSPNVIDVSVEGIPLNFKNSDHNPVRINIKLLNH